MTIQTDARTPHDYRDLCIEDLTVEVRDRERLLTEALVDAMAYRELAQQAIHRLHDYDGQIGRLRDETRCLREQMLRDERAAA